MLWAGSAAFQRSNTLFDLIRNFFSLRQNLPVPATILAYLSTEWFLGFHEKYNVTVWHNGLALKGFWLGAIQQSHLPASQHPAVAYAWWGNLLQWMLDHAIYSWFGYVVIAGELLIALAFISVIVGTLYRRALVVAATGALVALLFNFWFLMSGSAGVNALMPYLTGIAAVSLMSNLVARREPAKPAALTLESLFRETVPMTATKQETRTPVGTR